MLRGRLRVCAAALLLGCLAAPRCGAESTQFESAPVHPVELTPDGRRLLVTNLPGGGLVVLDLTGPEPARVGEIPVGIDPVTVRARSNHEAWVVNHISDSVSLVDLDRGVVFHTLDVGDAPTDLAFVGNRAFVVVSGENRIRIYDADHPDVAPEQLTLALLHPRSVAVSLDGQDLYVSAFDSGNKTTCVPYLSVEAGGGPPTPDPPTPPDFPRPPKTALIVQHVGDHWVDEAGRSWDAFVPYQVADHDIAVVDTQALTVRRTCAGVGTAILNLAVSPASGRLYASAIDAKNQIRFLRNQRGRFAENRVAIVNPNTGDVLPVHLNPHIDYDAPDGSDAERAASLSMPLDLVFRADGAELYVAAFGSRKIGVLSADGTVLRRIPAGEGPAGLAMDEPRGRLYCYNRIASTLSVVTPATGESHEVGLSYDPTPATIRLGRRYHYDGELTSSHGDLSCATCHMFGGTDGLAWDLGDPDAEISEGPGPIHLSVHPMKGPMMTQSMKSLEGTEPFHWRGDRTRFLDFNGNFVALMGRTEVLEEVDFQEYADFSFSLRYPPNPNRRLDGSLPDPASGPSPARGEDLFLHGKLFGDANCTICHTLPTGTNTTIIPARDIRSDQDLKVPQLRNLFEKTGFELRGGWALRGFGFAHDGVFHTIRDFLTFDRFDFRTDRDRDDVAAYLLSFDTGTPAAVGAQWTDRGGWCARGDTLTGIADQGVVGLVAHGIDSEDGMRGWTYQGQDSWLSDRTGEAAWSTAALKDLAAHGGIVTYTAVVAGTEIRLGIDRDEDGWRDGDERDLGSDPLDPESIPDPAAVDPLAVVRETRLELGSANPARFGALLRYTIAEPGPVRVSVHDVSGRLVRTLKHGAEPSGRAEIRWDLTDSRGRRVGRGLYLVRLTTSRDAAVRRIVVD